MGMAAAAMGQGAAGGFGLGSALGGEFGAAALASAGSPQFDIRALEGVLSGANTRNRPAELEEALDRINEDLAQQTRPEQVVAAGSLMMSTGVSLGYIVWLARGGALIASMASSIPVWASMDPMPVLSRYRGQHGGAEGSAGDADDPGMDAQSQDPLERLFSKVRQRLHDFGADSPPPAPTPDSVSAPAPATEPADVDPPGGAEVIR